MTEEPQANQPPYPGQPAASSPYGPPSGQAAAPSGQAGPPNAQAAAPHPALKNPLGFASAIVGAAGFLLGFLFTLIQLSIYSSSNYGGLGLLGGFHSVVSALVGITAVALGVVALTRRALPKTFAAVGIALGAALIVDVLNSLIFTIGLPLFYR